MDIVKLNPISALVNDTLTNDKYTICDSSDKPIAYLVRSFDMHEYKVASSAIAIARAGAGVNNIPIQDMTNKGVCVFNTPGANANAVKELVICALLLSCRKIYPAINWTQNLQDGELTVEKQVEKGKKAFIGQEIKGKVLGIIGLGAIGRLVSDAAIALGMEIIGYDPFLSGPAKNALNPAVKITTDLNDIFSASDFITLHVPATPDTKGFINKDSISKMKDGVVIINCARGELFNVDDVVEAVKSGKIGRVVTDLPSQKLLGVENIITFPHLGASTPEAEDNCAVMAANELKEFIENGNVINSVNFPCVKSIKTGDRVTILANIENAENIAIDIISKECTIKSTAKGTRGELTYLIFDLDKQISDNAFKVLDEKFIKVRKI